jgi:hypothetical protein
VRRFILLADKRHPDILGEAEVVRFLTHLASDRQVSASTQNLAVCALLFLYRHVLGRPEAWGATLVRLDRPVQLVAHLLCGPDFGWAS